MFRQYSKWTDQIPECLRVDLKSVKRALEYVNAKRVLDVGCGNGVLVRILCKLGYDAYGIDASEEGIRIANSKINDNRFFVCDVDCRELPAEICMAEFDTIVSTQTIEHLYSPNEFIRFCASVLPDNGRLIITTPYHGWLKNVLIALFGFYDDHVMALKDGGHIKFFSKRQLRCLLEINGFNVIAFEGMGRVPFVWKSMMMVAEKK